MWKNPWVVLVLGLIGGLVLGYALAERQPIPPARVAAASLAAQSQAAGMPEGHPPIPPSDTPSRPGQSAAESAALQQQTNEILQLLAANPDDTRLMVGLGNVYFDASRWDDARSWYERALEQMDPNPDVMTDLAVVYRNLSRPEEALELLDRAIAERPDHWQAWYNRVVVLHFDLHRHNEAGAALERLEEIAATNPEVPPLASLAREVRGG